MALILRILTREDELNIHHVRHQLSQAITRILDIIRQTVGFNSSPQGVRSCADHKNCQISSHTTWHM